MKILWTLLFLIMSSNIWAQEGNNWHVSITFKDGTVKKGYVLFDFRDFTRSFLSDYRSRPNDVFEFFPSCYPINDGLKENGFALCQEEAEEIHAESVKDIQPLPDQPKAGGGLGWGYPPMSKNQIKMMQNPLVCKEMVVDGTCMAAFFNYNPAIDKKELHHYLLEVKQKHKIGSLERERIWNEFLEKMKMEKIVYFVFNCQPID
jgi:hypothetical protein